MTKPFEWLITWLCQTFGSYPLGIFVFTVVINVAMIPFSIKQQKSMAGQARLRPKLEALKERCGNDNMKYQTEMQELYQKEGVSPMGGCLPMIIRLVILMIVYSSLNNLLYSGSTDRAAVSLAEGLNKDMFMFLGIDLTMTPSFSTDVVGMLTKNLTWTIPIASFVSQLISMAISNAQQKKNNPQAAQMGGGMKATMYIMPLFSLWITFSVSCATGFYWALSSIVNTVITLFVNHFYSADKILARDYISQGKARREKEKEIIAKSQAK